MSGRARARGPRSPRRDELAPLAAAALALGGASAAAVARLEALGGAFGDGRAYEAMVRGEPGAPPFNRRVLMPALVRRAGGGSDASAAFRLVAVPATVASAVATGALAARVAREAGAPPRGAAHAGLVAGGLVPAMPHGARMAAQVPAFNDGLAAALGTAWLLALTADARASRALAPPLLIAAALAREQWALVGALVAGVGKRSPAHLAAAALAAAVVASRPAGPGSEVYPPALALRRLGSREGFTEIAWAFAFVGGPLLALAPATVRARPGRPSALGAALAASAIQAGLALVGGSDTPRLLHGALPFLAAAVGVASARGDRRLAPVLAATAAGWRPLARTEATLTGYERFYLPYMHGALRSRARTDLARRGLSAATALLLMRRHGP